MIIAVDFDGRGIKEWLPLSWFRNHSEAEYALDKEKAAERIIKEELKEEENNVN